MKTITVGSSQLIFMTLVAIRRNSPERQAEVIARNTALLSQALTIEPKYPDVRAIWTERCRIRLTSSFSHPNPNLASRNIVGNHVLSSIARDNGLFNDQVLNVAHDLSVPFRDRPHGDIIELVGFSQRQREKVLRVLSADVVYAKQNGKHFAIDTEKVHERLLDIFTSNRPLFYYRERKVLGLLNRINEQHHANNSGLVEALLAIREAQMRLIGIDHIPEVPVSSLIGRYADGLEALERTYGKAFYESPLSDQFQPRLHEYEDLLSLLHSRYEPSPYIDGIYYGVNHNGKDRFGVRMPVAFNGRVFAFRMAPAYSDLLLHSAPRYYTAGGWVNRRGVAFIPKEGIYSAMRLGLVIPTVPTMMLVDCTASQVPQLGAADWERYAPEQANLQARWLGLDGSQVKNLVLTTHGMEAFGVRHEKGVSTGFFMSYITFGRENMARAIESGEYYEANYGTIVGGGVKMRDLVRR